MGSGGPACGMPSAHRHQPDDAADIDSFDDGPCQSPSWSLSDQHADDQANTARRSGHGVDGRTGLSSSGQYDQVMLDTVFGKPRTTLAEGVPLLHLSCRLLVT